MRLNFQLQEVWRRVYDVERGICRGLNDIATPRANGKVERVNRSLIEALATSTGTKAHWNEKLPNIVWLSGGVQFSPVELIFEEW